MANRIPDELIDQIREANDIVDVISEHVQLKRAGGNFKIIDTDRPMEVVRKDVRNLLDRVSAATSSGSATG